MQLQGHVVIGSRIGDGRQEPAWRRRHDQDSVSARQQPHHSRRWTVDRFGVWVSLTGLQPREVCDEQQQRRKPLKSRPPANVARRLNSERTTFSVSSKNVIKDLRHLFFAQTFFNDRVRIEAWSSFVETIYYLTEETCVLETIFRWVETSSRESDVVETSFPKVTFCLSSFLATRRTFKVKLFVNFEKLRWNKNTFLWREKRDAVNYVKLKTAKIFFEFRCSAKLCLFSRK